MSKSKSKKRIFSQQVAAWPLALTLTLPLLIAMTGCVSSPDHRPRIAISAPTGGPTENTVAAPPTEYGPEDLFVELEGTDFAPYDSALVRVVSNHWQTLIQATRFDEAAGDVTLKFQLSADGSVSNLVATSHGVNSVQAELCERAVREPGRFPAWTMEMRRALGERQQTTLSFTYKIPIQRHWQRRQDYVEAHPTLFPEFKMLILIGHVCIGMWDEEVVASWGPPLRVSKSISGRHETWSYADSQVHFTDGKVTKVLKGTPPPPRRVVI